MPNLRSLDSGQIKARYARRVEVYVEGPDDETLFKRYWFVSLQDRVTFIAARNGPAKSADGKPLEGCTGVATNVAHQRGAGVKAFGLLDRDAVPDASLASETNDSAYIEAQKKAWPDLHHCLYWEIENYLVDARALEQQRCDSSTRGNDERRTNEVWAELLSDCLALVPQAAVNAHFLTQSPSPKALGDGYAQQMSRQEIEAKITSDLLDTGQVPHASYEDWKKRIEAFDVAGEDEARVRALGRRIPGKALLTRFCSRHRLGAVDGIRGHLGRKLSKNPPKEIVDVLARWIEA